VINDQRNESTKVIR